MPENHEPVESHYYILGISHDASDRDIRCAYRSKAKDFHPDKHPGATEAERIETTAKFQQLLNSRDEMLDHEKRKTYDIKCATMTFIHGSNDPADWFRQEHERGVRERREAQERARAEEGRRNAERAARRLEQEARERKEREEREKKAAEQARKQAEERAKREREQRELERRQRERHEQEQRAREAEERERRRQEESPTPSESASESERLEELFFRIFVQQSYTSHSYRSRTTPATSSRFYSSDSGYSSARTTPSASRESTPQYQQTRNYESRGTQASGSRRQETTTPYPFTTAPKYSSYNRWTQSEVDGLLKLRRQNPSMSWDTLASHLNSQFGNGRNGNATRIKHGRSI